MIQSIYALMAECIDTLVVRNTNMCHSVPLENNDETNLSLTSVPFLEYVVSECMYSSVYIEIIDSLSNSQILVT